MSAVWGILAGAACLGAGVFIGFSMAKEEAFPRGRDWSWWNSNGCYIGYGMGVKAERKRLKMLYTHYNGDPKFAENLEP